MLLDDVYPPDIRVRKEASSLLAAGHRVTLLCRQDDEPARETVDGLEVRRFDLDGVHAGPLGLLAGARFLVTYVHGAWQGIVADALDKGDVDALHVHDLPLVRTALAAAGSEVPVVADLHENWPAAVQQYRTNDSWRRFVESPSYLAARLSMPTWRWRRIERDCVRRVDHVVTVAEEAARHYVRDCGADSGDVTVVPNVVDLERFDPSTTTLATIAGVDKTEYVVSYVGTLGGRHRGLGTVLRAMPALLDQVPQARLLVVGSGAGYEDDLRSLTRTLGVDERVTFTGWVDPEQVPGHIAASDVCLVPHRSTEHTETTVPHKLFQYMAMCRPVVVTDAKPLARIVEDAGCGRIVPAADPDAMADALAELVEPETAQPLGAAGRRAVETTYNWARQSEALLDVYRRLAAPTTGETVMARSTPR
jgi:glycosyltransferase involved in cell wall biosynthesis